MLTAWCQHRSRLQSAAARAFRRFFPYQCGHDKLGEMRLGMAIEAEDDALCGFTKDLRFAAVRKRAHIERERFLSRVDVMPRKRGQVAVIAATPTTSAVSVEQLDLSAKPAALLRGVALMAIVGVGILAMA